MLSQASSRSADSREQASSKRRAAGSAAALSAAAALVSVTMQRTRAIQLLSSWIHVGLANSCSPMQENPWSDLKSDRRRELKIRHLLSFIKGRFYCSQKIHAVRTKAEKYMRTELNAMTQCCLAVCWHKLRTLSLSLRSPYLQSNSPPGKPWTVSICRPPWLGNTPLLGRA
mmetsp:Transcript_70545/g.136132  ORF Transcript_70545/g.136132 Transcript_70545/m.136132 type:complete len:171 (+) Transcript_70545:248-760(+)